MLLLLAWIVAPVKDTTSGPSPRPVLASVPAPAPVTDPLRFLRLRGVQPLAQVKFISGPKTVVVAGRVITVEFVMGRNSSEMARGTLEANSTRISFVAYADALSQVRLQEGMSVIAAGEYKGYVLVAKALEPYNLWLTVPQVAPLVHADPRKGRQTIRRAIRRGELKAEKARIYRIRAEDALEWGESGAFIRIKNPLAR